MDRAKLIEDVKSLYNDIDKCISELVIARGKRDEQGMADAHWHMESLMVNAQQMCSVILDSLQEEPSIPDIVDEHFDEMLGEEPVSKVWHDANERPQKVGDRVAWVDKRFGIMHAGWYNKSAFGHEDMRDCACKHSFEEISKWAYTDDLLNLSTVERNGKNLKELKTMLDDSLAKETKDSWNEFLDEPVSEDLEEAAFDYAEACKYDGGEKLLCVEHFKAGANWQKQQDEKDIADMLFAERLKGADDGKRIMKEQMMKDAVIAHVNTYENIGGACYVEFVANISPSKYKKKKKTVKLIIIKED